MYIYIHSHLHTKYICAQQIQHSLEFKFNNFRFPYHYTNNKWTSQPQRIVLHAPRTHAHLRNTYAHTYTGRNDDFNIYGRHQKLTDAEARKAATQLQEILSLLPSGKTEFTASKTVVLDTHGHASAHTGPGGDFNNESVDLHTYGLSNDLGPLESLSHTESITAAYAQRPGGHAHENPSDIYRQMAKKQTAEEIYIQKHPNEGYDYRPTSPPPTGANAEQVGGYKYNNYHATNSALKDLTPIIAALEVAKRHGSTQNEVSKHFTVEKSIYKVAPQSASKSNSQLQYLPASVQKTKHIYFDPAQNKADNGYQPTYVPPPATAPSVSAIGAAAPPPPPPPPQPSSHAAAPAPSHRYAAHHSSAYNTQHPPAHPVYHAPPASASPYKVRRQVPSSSVTALKVHTKTGPYFKQHDYEIHDPLMFNRMLSFWVHLWVSRLGWSAKAFRKGIFIHMYLFSKTKYLFALRIIIQYSKWTKIFC